MNKKICLVMMATISPLFGCMSIPDNVVDFTAIEWPWPKNKYPDDHKTAYMEATAYCVKLQQYYAAGGSSGKAARFGLSALGTLAGAVFSPLASGSAAIAWSSFSGATNALQMSYDQSFDYTLVLARRAMIDKAMKEGKTAYEREQDDFKRTNAAIDMASNCAMAPARIDLKVLDNLQQALGNATSGAVDTVPSAANGT
ncbi:hypothetical protein [Aeromonas allosaccharophila]|uniref:hypothetical protein n=1 Tax=Aeromonas allosaccharophila TaxID=656 RepID=UPI0036D8398A